APFSEQEQPVLG
nr:Chain C, DQ2.2-glut-L1 [Triticum aestivum]6PY2_C Chain C, DQ2.2-glut-L1 [Triticum aestivum]